ncbi:Protein phosphatase 1H, partial [Saguinus oedipus]
VETVLADPCQGTVLSALSVCLTSFSGFFSRVINAGKSTHNEDQASCEVLTVKKKAGAVTSTPNRNSSKRRSSLPNGEGLQLKENS